MRNRPLISIFGNSQGNKGQSLVGKPKGLSVKLSSGSGSYGSFLQFERKDPAESKETSLMNLALSRLDEQFREKVQGCQLGLDKISGLLKMKIKNESGIKESIAQLEWDTGQLQKSGVLLLEANQSNEDYIEQLDQLEIKATTLMSKINCKVNANKLSEIMGGLILDSLYSLADRWTDLEKEFFAIKWSAKP